MNSYRIYSILESPDAWLFSSTTSPKICKELEFTDPKEHGKTRHLVSYECEADNLNAAWRGFHKVVSDFLDAAVFYTTSYISFLDWNHVVINVTQNVSLISLYERTLGTSLDFYSEERTNSVQLIRELAKKDIRLANFLHCYRMAVMVDSPETYDAYEKYLILACEALAGEVKDEDGIVKYDRKRLQKIIGKELHKKFFSHIDDGLGKTVRNAHFHLGKVMVSDGKPRKVIELVNQLRGFIANEYGISDLPILKIENSPTRGMHRDDGGIVVVRGQYNNPQRLMENCEPNKVFDDLIDNDDFEILSGPEASSIVNSM